jgi:putative ABC transport system ATP-binding protein
VSRPTVRASGPILECRGVHRFYFSGGDAEVAALKDVSFTVQAGEFVAIIGQSGSGKSTLLNLMAGLDDPDGGTVWVCGRRISHRDRSEQSHWRGCTTGVMTQSSSLVDHLSVIANVDLAASLRQRARTSRAARRQGLDRTEWPSGPVPSELLARVGLAERVRARPSTLSGGETARANLAVALAGDPTVLLADEPTAEVSRSEERDVLRLLSELRPPEGATVLVTHSQLVAGAADRVLEMDGGRLR